ncbi:MAG: HlyD family efflux transporter periplasmic adaptor subunit [Oscillospiraceae bacterium]
MSDGKVVKIDKNKNLVKAAYVLFAVCIISFFSYQIYKINYNPYITAVANEKTIDDNVLTRGFIVRDESLISSNVTGTLVPLVEDGKRVSNGDDVAVVFTNENAAKAYNRSAELIDEIAYFESLKNKIGVQTGDISTLDDRIYKSCENYVINLDNGKIEGNKQYEKSLRDAITSRQLSTGTTIDPTEKLISLNAELASLKAQAQGSTTIKANNPGYYIGYTDGYEKTVDYKNVTNIDLATANGLLDGSILPQSKDGYMGKLVDGFNWYIVCVLDYEKAMGLKIGGTIKVNFMLSTAESLNAEIVEINENPEGKSVVILKSNLMNTSYAGLRNEQIKLTFGSYKGLEIDNKAVREVEGQKGVYVLNGNIVSFKKIDILSSDSSFSICSTENKSKEYLKRYDNVIVEGTDLYDGKIVH